MNHLRDLQVNTPSSIEENLGNLIINSSKYDKSIDDLKPDVRQCYFTPIMLKLCSILQEFHRNNIPHTNLKERNVVFDCNGDILLNDPCLNILRNKHGKLSSDIRYFSPEMISEGSITEKTDMWELGVLIYHFLTGNYPFDGQSPNEIARKIISGSFDLGYINCIYHNLLQGLLRQNPSERYDINVVINILNGLHIGIEKNLNEITENDFISLRQNQHQQQQHSLLNELNNDEYIISLIYNSPSQDERIKRVKELYSLTHQVKYIHLLLDKSFYNNNEIIDLDLSGLGINDNCFLSIIEKLKRFEHIERLDISCNELTDASFNRLCNNSSNDIGYLKYLKYLDLSCIYYIILLLLLLINR